MIRKAWVFTDLSTSQTHSFELNPNKMDPPFNSKSLTTLPHATSPRTLKSPTVPSEWTFGGVLLSKTMYDELNDWMHRKHELEVNDHLYRVFRFLPTTVEFTDRRSTKFPWKHDYTVKGLLTQQYGGGIG